MKKVFLLMLLALAFCVQMNAQQYDTIWGRNSRYYYSEWYDTCSGYYDSVASPKLLKFDMEQGLENMKFGVSYFTGRPLLVKGLVALVEIQPRGYCHLNDIRNPEYLYLYQYTSSLQFRDSVRWDTAAPKIVRYPKSIDTASLGYYESYAFEGYFKDPVYVDSTFYIAGTFSNDTGNRATNLMIPTEYPWFMWRLTRDDCQYSRKLILYHPQQTGLPELGAGWRWYDEPEYYQTRGIGAFLPIVDSLYLVQGWTSDSTRGVVTGSGYYPDSTYTALYARGRAGYRFSHWNDGDTTNPRWVYVLSDTTFTAYFDTLMLYHLDVSSNNPEWGLAHGSGAYYDGSEVTISAVPRWDCRFVRWSDGDTLNPRQMTITQDSSIVAIFTDGTEGIQTVVERRGLRLSPNPALERLHIAVDRADHYTATIYTVTGALWLREEFNGTEGSVDISALTPGSYLLRLDAKGFSTSEVFVKKGK